jgi:phenol hydroxylase P0 protein
VVFPRFIEITAKRPGAGTVDADTPAMLQRPAPRTTATPGTGTDTAAPLVCDTSRRFVRVTEERADGLVAFDFAIGWPELSVELMLPRAAFDEFCTRNQVVLLDARADDPPPADHPEETDE